MKLIIALTDSAAPAKFAYSCVDDNYEPGCIQGFGATEREAISDYMDQYEDRLEEEEEEALLDKRMDPQTGIL